MIPWQERPNALSFDLEAWYHICDVDRHLPRSRWPSLEARVEQGVSRALRLLEGYGIRCTFFVVGTVAEQHPDWILEIHRRGHEIACHGYAHSQAYRLGPEDFAADAQRAKGILEEITGMPVLGFRAPQWSIRKGSYWAHEILERLGFRYDSSVFPIRLVGDPRACPYIHRVGSLYEFPPSVVRLAGENLPFSGGISFRIVPFGMIRSGIRRLNARGHPALCYFHTWELDPDHPRVSLPVHKHFVHYAGLRGVEERLKRLLDLGPWGTVSEVLAEYLRVSPSGTESRHAP